MVSEGGDGWGEPAMSGELSACLSVFLLWHVKAPSSARHVSNLSFRMSATIIPSFVTSFDQRMKNCRLTQTRLLLGEKKKGNSRTEEEAKVKHRQTLLRLGLG